MAWAYAAGAAGTVTLPTGARLLAIRAESHSAAGTIAIFGGTAIPVDGGTAPASHMVFNVPFPERGSGENPIAGATPTIVFTNTASYFVQYAI